MYQHRAARPNSKSDVHHNVHSGELTPHLERSTETNTAENTRLEEIEVGLGTLLLLEPDLVLNFGNLELHELGVGVTLTVEIREDLYGFGVPFVINEPTWTLRVIVSCMLDDIDEIGLLR